MTTAVIGGTRSSRLFGAILLISGTAIGAAMLALPVSTGRAGLVASLAVMACVWLYLVLAALYLLEVAFSMPNANILTMVEKSFGKPGKVIGCSAYLFLLYALNTAYLFGITHVLRSVFHVNQALLCVPLLGLFWLLLKKGVGSIDSINRLFMIGFGATWLLLLLFAMPQVSFSNMGHFDAAYIIPSFAIMLCAFGYHIVIPSLISYLEHDVKQIQKAIWIGSVIPLVVYSIWQIVALGTITDSTVLHAAFAEGLNSAELLAQSCESTLISSVNTSFAFFAMITSFFGVSMALWDFLKDGCKGLSDTSIFAISFALPVYFALQNEQVFLKALEYAGAYGVVILLALLPALMVWKKRYVDRRQSAYKAPGGKALLIVFMAISVSLIVVQLV